MKHHKEKLKKVFAAGFLAIAFSMFVGVTFTAFAAETTSTTTVNALEGVSYTPLVNLPLGKDGADLSKWTLSEYLSGMLRLIIALGGAVAVLMAIVGGVQYVASGIAPSAKNDAKARITNAFIGLAIILTAYLLLNTINPDLVNFKLSLPKIEGTSGEEPEVTTDSIFLQKSDKCAEVCDAGYSCMSFIGESGDEVASCQADELLACVPPTSTTDGTAWPSDEYERTTKLKAAGISVNKSNCTKIGKNETGGSNCTSVCGLQSDVITEITTIKQNCDKFWGVCTVQVTGGTEHWLHKTHGTYRNVDFNSNDGFDKYITSSSDSNYLGTGQTCGVSDAAHWELKSNGSSLGVFVYEENSTKDGYHWHACF